MKVAAFTLASTHASDLKELLFQLSGKRRNLSLENHPNVVCVGAFDGERLVGFAQLFILSKTTFTIGHLEDVIVHLEFRAQGLGHKIVEEVIRIATVKGCSVINLTTRPERAGAIALYEAFGFVEPGNATYRLTLTHPTPGAPVRSSSDD